MSLEKDEWTKLCKVWSDWEQMVRETDERVRVTLDGGWPR